MSETTALTILEPEGEIISRSPEAREERGQRLSREFVKFASDMVPLFIQVRQDFLDKKPNETICGAKTFDEYCTGVLRYSRRRIQQLIQGNNPASAKHDGSHQKCPSGKKIYGSADELKKTENLSSDTKIYHCRQCKGWHFDARQESPRPIIHEPKPAEEPINADFVMEHEPTSASQQSPPPRQKRDPESIAHDNQIAGELAQKFRTDKINADVVRSGKEGCFHVNLHDMTEADVLRLRDFLANTKPSKPEPPSSPEPQSPAPEPAESSSVEQPKQTWMVDLNFLSKQDADELYDKMMALPWTADGSDAFVVNFGKSYVNGRDGGGPALNEIAETPEFLKTISKRIAEITHVRANYVQCHRYGPNQDVRPHYDPRGMIVPMLCVGQERTFRVGGDVRKLQPLPQKSRPVKNHKPDAEILMTHGSLLVFDGPTAHSMHLASDDQQFNPNGREWRISILFRYTSDCLRKNGTGKNRSTGETCDRKAYVKQQHESLTKAPSLFEPSEPSPVDANEEFLSKLEPEPTPETNSGAPDFPSVREFFGIYA